ncbi:hypothetical protein BDZ91DRAFT_395251 [Kalaharituber pfeilii]|nr:hypothetical protein BDZ91DRAFT_395251 [Kalaharituber pfeilii]
MSSTDPSPLPGLVRYALRSSAISTPLPLQLLPATSRAPITRYYHLEDKKLALGSQLLQRLLVCQTHRSVDPTITLQAVKLWKDPESGRPGYVPLPDSDRQYPLIYDYNVSHHSGLVVLAALLPSPFLPPKPITPATPPRQIGVDVVPSTLARRSHPPEDFLASFLNPSAAIFTAREVSAINTQATWPLKIRMFYIHWALKEAYVKATGTGLVTDLTLIEFRNVKIFDVDEPGTRRYIGTKLYLSGVEQPHWYLELESYDRKDEDDNDEEGETGRYYIAIATEREWLADEDLVGDWMRVDIERDVLPWHNNGQKQ